ncbi:hypothetical protein D8674_012781 [Pyrus ussuriensis x Pyrus communis]|uniref:Uncharacterized protein n=1 Tax=Pyrus ussuriensis x Pyrus communis TaxID=2448454 RepID=A0A5N5GTC1_9ROSA|nr:hypothetical protein D8674_012781 [Pyrus ussuriensis x Pyrus communis]
MSGNKISSQIPPEIGPLKVETTAVLVGPVLDDELLSFVRCLRVSGSLSKLTWHY